MFEVRLLSAPRSCVYECTRYNFIGENYEVMKLTLTDLRGTVFIHLRNWDRVEVGAEKEAVDG